MYRYLVSHEAGIHILFLPLVAQLNKFVESPEGTQLTHSLQFEVLFIGMFCVTSCFLFSDQANNCLPKFDNLSNTVAEYLLCTRVCGTTNSQASSESTVPSPILGLALSSSPATLIALLAGGEIVSLLLSSLHLPSASSQSLLAFGSQIETPKVSLLRIECLFL